MRIEIKNLAIASATVVAVVFAVTFIVSIVDAVGSAFAGIVIPLLVASTASFVALIIVIFWAIPIHFVLQRLKRFDLGWYVIVAIVPSVTYVYCLKPFGVDSGIYLFEQALICSFVGAFGAVAFWYIVVYKQRITKPSNGASR